MASKKSYYKSSRDAGGFVALPWQVIDSAAYQALSPYAKALMIEIARQYSGSNNGGLRCGRAFMQPRGWNSMDMLTKAKRELLEAGLLFETVKGGRPNKASWYAVTWQMLDKLDGYDAGTTAAFERGSYRKPATSLDRPTVLKGPKLHRPTVQEGSPLDRPTVL